MLSGKIGKGKSTFLFMIKVFFSGLIHTYSIQNLKPKFEARLKLEFGCTVFDSCEGRRDVGINRPIL